MKVAGPKVESFLLLSGALFLYEICSLNAVSQMLEFLIFRLDPFSHVDTRFYLDNYKIRNSSPGWVAQLVNTSS